jgi:hypothetical protein
MNICIQHFSKMIRPSLIFLLFCAGFSFSSSAQVNRGKSLSDKASVSLLTADPGPEVYSQYGHTAIRICDPDNHFDLVFNYGLFDFDSPNFIWRFVTGRTDYIVGATSYMDFLLEYQVGNRAVTEQVLNLKPEEKEKLWQALIKNIQPENRTYRYNFFFNNCATKPRDMIVSAIDGKVDYQWKGEFKSLRDEVHFFTDKYPWTQFGIDFTLGAPADDPANLKAQQFAPDVLMESFSKAVILNDSAQARLLVLETHHPVVTVPSVSKKAFSFPKPIIVLWIIFAIIAVISYFEIKKKKHFHIVNAIIFGITGIIGTVIAFLVFFSVHPTTNINFLLLWLHPLHLVYAICLAVPSLRNRIAFTYLGINLPFQIFALAGSLFLPQYFHPAMYPLLLILILRSSMALWFLKKNHSNA